MTQKLWLLLFMSCFMLTAVGVTAAGPIQLFELSTVAGLPLRKHAEYSVQPGNRLPQEVFSKAIWVSKLPTLRKPDEVVWLRYSLNRNSTKPMKLVCHVSNNEPTTLYVDNKAIVRVDYFVKSLLVRNGITYFYQFDLPERGYLYIKMLPKTNLLSSFDLSSVYQPSPDFYLFKASVFQKFINEARENHVSSSQVTYIIIGGLAAISLISLIIAVFFGRRLFTYYFLYGFSPLILLVVKELCFGYINSRTIFDPDLEVLARSVEFFQLLSLAAYILFIGELLDLRKTHKKLVKTMNVLAALLLLQGFVEVSWLLLTADINGYESLLTYSGMLLFPVFAGLIIWISVKVRHHLVKYVVISNGIFVVVLLLGFLRFRLFPEVGLPAYTDQLFTLPFATLLEMIVFSFAIAAKISHDNALSVAFERQLRETEMAALRSQMNPHFIFNSLNTIRNFILRDENKKANQYLSKFAKLLRQILNLSRTNSISLSEEIETIRLYLEIESVRFDSGFQYEINVPEELELEAIPFPPLLLQPYVENAIWHGLRNSEKPTKELSITITEAIEGKLEICIRDNGIGRKQAEQFSNATRQSLGTTITQERVDLFNKVGRSQLTIETHDNAEGTAVIITYTL